MLNIVKGMHKAKELGKLNDPYFADEANFEHIAKFALDHYMKDGTYTLEANISDSRGRSIYKALKRLANPIANKDFRAMLVMRNPVLVNRNNTAQLDDIYYFIAELTGSKATTEQGKIDDGIEAYSTHWVPELDLEDAEDRKDLHELIYLERIYTTLDRLFKGNLQSCVFDISIECDASMSLAQIAGALLGSKKLLQRTNVIGQTLSDPWKIKGIRRKAGKAYFTPTLTKKTIKA